MPFAVVLLGAVLIVTAIRGSHLELASLIKSDFTGSQPFWLWLIAIVAVGALGYSPVLRTPARMLLGLIVLGMLIANGGVFDKLAAAVRSPPPASAATDVAGDPTKLPGSFPVAVQQTGSGSSSTASTASTAISTAAKVLPFLGI